VLSEKRNACDKCVYDGYNVLDFDTKCSRQAIGEGIQTLIGAIAANRQDIHNLRAVVQILINIMSPVR
jgi:hypothetical protein